MSERAREYAIALGAVAVATALFIPLRPFIENDLWPLLYLLIVVFIARRSGVHTALICAISSFMAWNFFFLPPHGTLWVDDPRDWLALLAFLAVALTIGFQTGKMRERERDASRRNDELSALNRFSTELVSEVTTPAMLAGLESRLAALDSPGELALLVQDDNGLWRMLGAYGEWNPVDDAELRQAMDDCVTAPCRHKESLLIPLTASGARLGVLWVSGYPGLVADGSKRSGLLHSLSNLVAAYLERNRLHAAEAQVRMLTEADRAKSTFVSSISHELKTPLTSLMATLSNLLRKDLDWTPEALEQELDAMLLDTSRLDSAITSLLDLSRLEASAWRPERTATEIGEILSSVLYGLSADEREKVTVEIPEGLPLIDVDPRQMARVFEHLIRNALMYGGEHVKVRAAAPAVDGMMEVRVEDDGPGIAQDERMRVFERFYRGATSEGSPGTGLGLAIASEIALAHGAGILVDDAAKEGAAFVLNIPVPGGQREGGLIG